MPHILILEPDHLLAGSLEHYFASANMTTSIHSDPQMAISSADRRRPDIVVAELQLAGRSGVEFLYEFRSYPDWQDLPAIIFINFHPEQMTEYAGVLDELNIQTCLYKTTSGLPELLQSVLQALPKHAKV